MAATNPEQGLSNFPPRIHLVPPGGVISHGEDACRLADIAGVTAFPWQSDLLDEILTEDAEGLWTAQHSAIIIARQNGKSEVLAIRELFGLMILGERIIHTAHLVSTALESFERLLAMIDSHPDLKAQKLKEVRTNGRYAIHMKNGGQINFMARSKGSARGFTVDLLILDEAMMMASDKVAALLPTISATDNPQVIYAGSAAPSPEDAEHLGGIRAAVMAHLEDPGNNRIVGVHYAEWSADVCDEFCAMDCDAHDAVDDPVSWAKANPSLGLLQTVRKIEAEYSTQKKTGIVQFLRERLSVGDWPSESGGWLVIRQRNWEDQIDLESVPEGFLSFSVDVAPDRSTACISVAGMNAKGKQHVEITGNPDNRLNPIDYRDGDAWVVPRAKELKAKFKHCVWIVDKGSQAGALLPQFERAGIETHSPSYREYAQACGSLRKAVMPSEGEEATLVHLDQGPLNRAVAGADKKDATDLWKWARKGISVDITPLVSATNALWGLVQFGSKKKASPWVRRGTRGN